MASFKTHLTVATIGSTALLLPLINSSNIALGDSFILVFFGAMGGILPDLDSDNSTPVNIAFNILSFLFPLTIVIKNMQGESFTDIIIMYSALVAFFYFIIKYLFLKATVHRGVFHTIGMGVLFGELLIIYLTFYLHMNDALALFSGGFLTFGFILHLLLDEIYSVNLLGIKVKQSFGTALKFYYSKNKLGSLFVYIAVLLLYFKLPNFH